MHDELTVLAQVFGQQGTLQVTAEGVLRTNRKLYACLFFVFAKYMSNILFRVPCSPEC